MAIKQLGGAFMNPGQRSARVGANGDCVVPGVEPIVRNGCGGSYLQDCI